MKPPRALYLSALLLFSLHAVLEPGRMPLSAQSESSEKKTAPAPLTELEKKFMETLSSSTLAGRWRLAKDGKLGDEREDKYTIGSVTKLGADLWVIGARIQYGGKDVTLPVPVKVFWAGDTPVISITNAGIPGLGTYTARVMVYGDYYTGTWSAPDHAGFLCGTILKEAKDIKETKSPKEPASEGDKKGDK